MTRNNEKYSQKISKYKYNLLKIFILILIWQEKKPMFSAKKVEPKMLANYCNISVNNQFIDGRRLQKNEKIETFWHNFLKIPKNLTQIVAHVIFL